MWLILVQPIFWNDVNIFCCIFIQKCLKGFVSYIFCFGVAHIANRYRYTLSVYYMRNILISILCSERLTDMVKELITKPKYSITCTGLSTDLVS